MSLEGSEDSLPFPAPVRPPEQPLLPFQELKSVIFTAFYYFIFVFQCPQLLARLSFFVAVRAKYLCAVIAQ